MKHVQPLDLTAGSLYFFQHPFWQSGLLRWVVTLTDPLIDFGAILNHSLKDSGAFLYFEGQDWYPRMVTALEDVKQVNPENYLKSENNTLPHHLFTADKVIVSEILGHRQFKILDVIELRENQT
jgi:hypothetical protein